MLLQRFWRARRSHARVALETVGCLARFTGFAVDDVLDGPDDYQSETIPQYRLPGVVFMNRSKTLPLASLALFGLVAWLTPSACFAEAAPPKKIVTIEGITEYHLDNGLRVLVFPDPSVSTITVNLTVLVGSRHEGYGETGMAHLLQHMVFKGTPTFLEVPKALRDHGASFNGTTNVDRTNYFETLPATDANLEFGIQLESDRLVNSFVKREDLTSDMTVVRNKF